MRDKPGPALPRLAERLASALAGLGGLCLAVMIGLTVVDVSMRYLFSAPLRGVVELITILQPLIVFLGLCLVSHERAHISVTLIEPVLGPRSLRVYRGIGIACTVLGAMLLSVFLLKLAVDYRAWRQASLVLRLDLWPLIAGLSVLALLAAVLGAIGPRSRPGAEESS